MATPKKTASTGAKKASTRKKTASKPKTARKRAPRKTTAKAAPEAPVQAQAPEPSGWVVRNLTGLEFGFRLERQQDKGRKRVELRPRGQRGDFYPLREEDLNDQTLLDQINVGVVEIISASEAAKIARKQTTNQQAVHPALAMLRNEYGEEYDEGAFSVAQSFEDQGVVVAELVDGQIAVDRGGIVRPGREAQPDRRNRLRRPGDRPGGSPMVSQGGPIRTSPGNAAAAQADAKARRKTVQGPAAGLSDGIKVTLAPTQHT